MRESLALARDAGVAIGSGSDLLGPRQRRRAGEIVEKAKHMGAMAAIVSATKTNAALFRLEDRIGTVEEGKDADLILVAGNPLEDIAVLADAANIRVVVKQGVILKDLCGLTAMRRESTQVPYLGCLAYRAIPRYAPHMAETRCAPANSGVELLDDAQRQRLLDWAGSMSREIEGARAPGASIGPIAETLHISKVAEGGAAGRAFRLDVVPELLNPHGVLHGGAVYTMIDYSMGAATMAALPAGEVCATIEIKVSYLAGAARGGGQDG